MRVLGLLLALALASPSLLTGENLAAAAAREKARRERLAREKAEAGRTITQEDLSAAHAPVPESRPSATPAATPAAEGTPDGTVAGRDAERARLVEWFRGRHRAAAVGVARAEAELADALRQLGALPNVTVAPPELYYAREVAEERVARARERLTEAEARRDESEDEARRAGLYPGDLR